MANTVTDILQKPSLSRDDIIRLLNADQYEADQIFNRAADIRIKAVGRKVYLRGLVEVSNQCSKNCYYCGIRRDNHQIDRYTVSHDEALKGVELAVKQRMGSVVFQSGERSTPAFRKLISDLLVSTHQLSGHQLGITLSCGEQSEETYRDWFEKGAHRYLLRIETTNQELFRTIHPNDKHHDFSQRLHCLQLLKKIGYQTGTGVMIGIPGQQIEDLADDLLFMRDFDIDMCGMGPYLEHEQTPLYAQSHTLPDKTERLFLSLKMIAVLRLLVKDINIAATTALQTIHPMAREAALLVGANVVMPNVTPGDHRESYQLYQGKPDTSRNNEDITKTLERNYRRLGLSIGYAEKGDSLHYRSRHRVSEDRSLSRSVSELAS